MSSTRLISVFTLTLALTQSPRAGDGLPDDIMSTTQAVKSATPKPPTPASQATPKPAAKASSTEEKPAKKEKPKTAKQKTESETAKPVKNSEAPAAADTAELKALKEIDKRYQDAKSVQMDVDKILLIGLLGKEKKSKGRLLLSKGKMRMEMETPEKSVVVVDGKTLWVADYPPAEFKGAAVQVLKGSLASKKGVQQSFVGLLTRGGLLKHFKVAGVQKDNSGRKTYFLAPNAQSSEFKRAQLTTSVDGQSIVELRFWDERDNETRMQFSNVKFNGSVPATTFEFVPPENADITTI